LAAGTTSSDGAAPGRRGTAAFRFVIVVGVLSLFADMVYEGAHSINGQFLRSLGASAFIVGAVAGGGELAAYGLRFFSGALADRTRAYWPITIFGYAVNLLAVPALALTDHWLPAAGLMLLERTGKAIRNPARDAILSHAARRVGVGWAWGIHEAMDETGAALGPLVVAGILFLHGGFRFAYAILLVPAVVSLAILLYARRMNPHPQDLEPARLHAGASGFGPGFWFLTLGAILVAVGFADFSLIAYHLGKGHVVAEPVIPLLYAAANGINAGAALGLGRAFDKLGPWVLGVAMLIPIASAPLLFSASSTAVFVGILLWALGVTVQQSLFKALLSRILPARRRASGFGTFDGLWGVASFGGGLLLGWLYDRDVGLVVAASIGLLVLAVPVVWLALYRARRTTPTSD
jgi:MFS family permease